MHDETDITKYLSLSKEELETFDFSGITFTKEQVFFLRKEYIIQKIIEAKEIVERNDNLSAYKLQKLFNITRELIWKIRDVGFSETAIREHYNSYKLAQLSQIGKWDTPPPFLFQWIKWLSENKYSSRQGAEITGLSQSGYLRYVWKIFKTNPIKDKLANDLFSLLKNNKELNKNDETLLQRIETLEEQVKLLHEIIGE